MIDVEIDIFDAVASAVIEKYPDVYISGEHVVTPPMFPAVFLEQTLSVETESQRDSSSEENANTLTYTANVYSNSQENSKAECKEIMGIIDAAMRAYNFTRLSAQPIDNAADPSIYRYTARWSGIVDKANNMYWR